MGEETVTPEEARKLVGGWAAGTLTESERKALLEAALGDQDLFNTLMAEQPLKELLDDSSARAELLSVLDEAKPRRNWFFRPWPIAAAGTLAAAAILTIAISHREPERPMVAEGIVRQVQPAPTLATPPAKPPAQIAKRRREEPAPAPAPPPELKAKAEIEPPRVSSQEGVSGAVVGGVPGGVIGGIVGGVPGGAPPPAPPSAAKTEARRFSIQQMPAPAYTSSLVKQAADSAAALAQPFKYRILKREEQNEYREAAAGAQFSSEDAIVLSVDVLRTGYLRLFEGTKPLSALLPVQAGKHYTLPSEGFIVFGPNPADRVLTLRFTWTPDESVPPVVNIPVTLRARP